MKEPNFMKSLTGLFKDREKSALLEKAETFSQIYDQYQIPVFRYIYGLTGGSQQDAEDLTAETFMRAWKARHAYHGEAGQTIGWFLTIAHNLVIDLYRRNQTNPLPDEYDPLEEEDLAKMDTPQNETPESYLISNEQQEVMLKVLQTLPNKPREILVLRYLLNWPVNRISHHLNMPENTVSVIIRRSLAHIRYNWPVEKE